MQRIVRINYPAQSDIAEAGNLRRVGFTGVVPLAADFQ
ncbi:hypothetical protein J2T26_003897 [Citrobacter farmeri]|nr:hypothetical protein [Citrobacter farmeri]MCW2423941.1 hypothetical protein [Citrobacter farmeri]